MKVLIKKGNIYKNGDIIGFQDFDANKNIELKYLEFLNRPEYYKIFNVQNYSLRNAWTSLSVLYKSVGNYSDSHMSNHSKLVRKINGDL